MATINIIISISLLLIGCQSRSEWEVAHLPAHDAARLVYPVRDRVHGMGVTMIAGGNTHLEVYVQAIPPYQNDPKKAFVVMQVEGKKMEGIAYRHEGGQRVTLSTEMADLLIATLKKKSPVTLELEGYKTILDATDFPEQYAKLPTAPLKNPFQLPFKI